MGKYRIADLNVEIDTEAKTLLSNLEKYTTDFSCKPNINLSMSNDLIIQLMEENEGLTADYIQTQYFACLFSRELFDFNGIPIHAYAVEYDGKCIMFASPFEGADIYSYLPKDKVFTIDYPAIRLLGEDFYVYDTPFGNEGDKAYHAKLPLQSIVFIDSKRFDSLKKLQPKDFVAPFTRAVIQNIKHERTKHTLYMLEKLQSKTDIYGAGKINDIDFIFEHVS